MRNMLLSLFLALFLISCGGSEDQEQKLEKALDSGDFDYVISTLGDCASQKGEDNKTACYNKLTSKQKLDLGAAYYGKGEFYLLSLADKIESARGKDDEDQQIFKVVFDLLGDDLKDGVDTFETILPTNLDKNGSKLCNMSDYENLDRFSKQACVSINPVLLKDLLDDKKKTSSQRDGVVSIEDLVKVKKLVNTVIDGIDSDDIASLINKDGKAMSKNDINGNSKIDSVEASLCAIDSSSCNVSQKVVSSETVANVFDTSTNDNVHGITLKKITVSNSSETNSTTFWRLIKNVSGQDTIVTTTENFCDAKAQVVKTCEGADTTTPCYPCPDIQESGEPLTAIQNIGEVINNDDAMESFAIAKTNDNDGKTAAKKVEELRVKICEGATPACAKTDGKTVVTQEAFIQYLQKDSE